MEQEKESTQIPLLPLMGAENKTEIQLEKKHMSHWGKESPLPATKSPELSLQAFCLSHWTCLCRGLGTSLHLVRTQLLSKLVFLSP